MVGAKDGASATNVYGHYRHTRFGRYHKCAHAERQQAGHAGECALREKDWAAARLQGECHLLQFLHTAFRIEALDKIRSDMPQINARNDTVQQFPLGHKTEMPRGTESARQGRDEHDSVKIAGMVCNQHARCLARQIFQSVNR